MHALQETALPRLRAPRGLSPAAERRWRHGDDTGGVQGRHACLGDPPVPGDLWIATGGEDDFGPIDVALVLVTAVFEDSGDVYCIPVTEADVPEHPLGYQAPDSLLGIPLVYWPGLVTAVNYRCLNRRLGSQMEAFALARLARSPYSAVRAPYPVHGPDSATYEVSDEAREFASGLCDAMGLLLRSSGDGTGDA